MLKLDLFETLGDWNPQLLRELKGRLKPRNLILAIALSVLGQFLLWVYFLIRIPHPTADLAFYKGSFPSSHPYCTGFITYENDRKCLVDAAGDLLVDWQRWSLDLFLVLSIIGIFSLLVGGTYLLINNLVQEERKGTLNFIRQSPRSPQNVLWGKILGVPVLLYTVALLAVPLHLGAGLAANIPLVRILCFYGVLAFSCLSFYSFALLFSLISLGVLSRFQALFGSGIVFLVIFVGSRSEVIGNSVDWLKFFSPALILQYLISATGIRSTSLFLNLEIQQLQWFNLFVGTGMVGITGILVLNYSLWMYWSWQAIQRRFLSSSKTIFSKSQSYLLVACFEVMALGFATYGDPIKTPEGFVSASLEDFRILLLLNYVLFFGLIIALTPQRQAVIDWARYRQQKLSSRKGLFSSSLLRDLLWGEKSPAIVAIALNLIITAIILVPWIVMSSHNDDKLLILMALVLNLSLIMVCAAISQLVALMHAKAQELWIIGTLATVIILPPFIFSFLPTKITLSLFTILAVTNTVYVVNMSSIFLALLGQLSLIALCSVQITRQLKKAGASDSVALFAPSKA